MGSPESPRSQFWYTLLVVLISVRAKNVACRNTYQVGDLNAWGIPPPSSPQLYAKWSSSHNFTVGDTLFFLYPPSQDSVIQVTRESYTSCNLKDPILYMNDGNSLFNITKPGEFYFISGVDGHCGKSQKLHISVYGDGYSGESPSADGPTASAPSYPTNFGSIPMQQAAGPTAAAALPLRIGIPVLFMSVSAALVSLLVI